MIGSTEMQSDALEDQRQHDFDDYCQVLEADREREESWRQEQDDLSPLLHAMVNDLKMRLTQAVKQRQYRLALWG